MNCINGDDCFTEYLPRQLISCDQYSLKFCYICIKNHKH